jgi:subtilase family serine protease
MHIKRGTTLVIVLVLGVAFMVWAQGPVLQGTTKSPQAPTVETTVPPNATSTLSMMPDLVITTGKPTVTPSTVKAGGNVRLSAWTVKNQGSKQSDIISTGFYLSTDPVITSSDTFLSDNYTPPLDPGAEFAWGGPYLTIPATTTPGTYYLGILVDRKNSVIESNEKNNYVSVQITVTAY